MTRRIGRCFAINLSIVTMLGCGVAISEMATPDRQDFDTSVVDTFDPTTGQIIRSNH